MLSLQVWDQLDLILDNEWTARSRFGAFCIALGFGFSSTMTNTYANTVSLGSCSERLLPPRSDGLSQVPFGADISSLAPKFCNIIRGQADKCNGGLVNRSLALHSSNDQPEKRARKGVGENGDGESADFAGLRIEAVFRDRVASKLQHPTAPARLGWHLRKIARLRLSQFEQQQR